MDCGMLALKTRKSNKQILFETQMVATILMIASRVSVLLILHMYLCVCVYLCFAPSLFVCLYLWDWYVYVPQITLLSLI